ncbi:MAG: hypothetical protein PVI86_10805 [Phycisphaerae bacterium]|jgi:hypothetical protein
MTGPCLTDVQTDGDRPVGEILPQDEKIAHALGALTGGRLGEVETRLDTIPDSPANLLAWKTCIRGLVALQRLQLSESLALFLQAAGLAVTQAMSHDNWPESESMRLCAHALHHAGRVRRRQDAADQAYQTHLAAYRLREKHGSSEELCRTAVELGLDCDVAGRHEHAQRWHRTAVEHADQIIGDAVPLHALAWTHLATSLGQDGQHPDAVDAARTAARLLDAHDAGSLDAARARFRLGSALLRLGEAAHSGGAQTATILTEARGLLRSASEEFSAFGSRCESDLRSATEQLEVADRLIATVAS